MATILEAADSIYLSNRAKPLKEARYLRYLGRPPHSESGLARLWTVEDCWELRSSGEIKSPLRCPTTHEKQEKSKSVPMTFWQN